jgi:hypothetical protein
MKRTLLTAVLTLSLWGMPAMAGPPGMDSDGDGVHDGLDNCSDVINAAQDDTDGDDCGNLCDANFTQSGQVGFSDFGEFGQNFGAANQNYKLTEPVTNLVGFGDFGIFSQLFGTFPGPSGTTAGTVACP